MIVSVDLMGDAVFIGTYAWIHILILFPDFSHGVVRVVGLTFLLLYFQGLI